MKPKASRREIMKIRAEINSTETNKQTKNNQNTSTKLRDGSSEELIKLISPQPDLPEIKEKGPKQIKSWWKEERSQPTPPL